MNNQNLKKEIRRFEDTAKESPQADTQIEEQTGGCFGIKRAPYPCVNTFLEDKTNDNLTSF